MKKVLSVFALFFALLIAVGFVCLLSLVASTSLSGN